MFRNSSLTVLAVSVLCSAVALAKAPASAPAGSTGMCKDGTYTTAASKSGACSGHDGVKKWYGAAADASAAPAAASSDSGTSSGKATSKSKSKGSKSDAAAPASAPAAASTASTAAAAGITGTCKDGSTTTATSKKGACSGHGGVKDWGASAAAAAPAAPAAPAGAMSKAAPAAPAGTMSKAAPAAAAMPAAAAAPAKPAMAAPGGGAGQVWVNKPSKVYHCQGDQWYGKTKDGAYMTEAQAIAQGYRADHGKACQ